MDEKMVSLMDKSSISCIGRVLFVLTHPSNVDTFVYPDSYTGKTIKFKKNNAWACLFYSRYNRSKVHLAIGFTTAQMANFHIQYQSLFYKKFNALSK